MNIEDIDRLRGVPIDSVFGKQDPNVKINLGPKRQAKYRAMEVSFVEEGRDTLIPYLAQEIWINGKSRNLLAKELGLTRDEIGAILTFAGVPYPTHAEANARMVRSPEALEAASMRLKTRWEDSDYAAKMTLQSQTLYSKRPELRELMIDLSTKLWQNPTYKALQATHAPARTAGLKRSWEDPDFRKRMSDLHSTQMLTKWQVPEYKKMQSDAHRDGWTRRVAENPDLLVNVRENMKKMWQNPKFAAHIAEIASRTMTYLSQDKEFKAKRDAASSAKWGNLDFRERNAEGVRRAHLNTDRRYYYLGIKGQRRDLPFLTQSCWESNIARTFMLLGREFYLREPLRLTVTDQHRNLFKFEQTTMDVDFVVVDPRGNLVLYEILTVASTKTRVAKFNMAIEQYPQFSIRPITKDLYAQLEERFKPIIDADPNFCGWETQENNLKSQPEKFAVKES